MKFIILLTLLLIFEYHVFSQRVLILDQQTGEPVKNANIYKKNKTLIGTSTDSLGFFNNIFHLGDTIIISHINYIRKTIPLKRQDIIYISPIKQYISEIIIGSRKKPQLQIKNPWIIDYEILENGNILSFQISNTGSTLVLYKEKKRIYSRKLSELYDYIENDCLENLFLVNKEFSKIIRVKDNTITFSDSISTKILKDSKQNCEFFIENNQYFKRYTNSNKFVTIFSYNWETDFVDTVYNSSDFDFLNFLIDLKETMGENNTTSNSAEDKKLFLDHLSKKKSEVEIFKISSNLVVVDLVNLKIVTIKDSEIINSIKIIQGDLKKIIHILQDRITEQIYYFAEENNKINIYHLDIYSGKFKSVLTMNRHIEEPKIYKGILYYLQYDMHKDSRELYKIPL